MEIADHIRVVVRENKPLAAWTRRRRALAVLLMAVLLMAAGLPGASAFKPATHVKTGESVLDDLADGMLSIAGREYGVDPAVRDALVDWPEFYSAGVIGPDGFPDLIYGNQVIHTEDAGLWFKHVFTSARSAQNDSSYTSTEKSQILAFAYGFMMHGAGDLWAHTLVNDFSRGVFPAAGDIISDSEEAAVAVRHIIIEAYVEDATVGIDRNRDRGPAPFGDISDDSSFAIDLPTAAEFVGVGRFIYETLIDPAANTPSSDRGPLLDFFLDLRSTLAGSVDSFDPDPVETLADAWQDAKSEFDDVNAEAGQILDLLDEFYDCDFTDLTCSRILIAAEIILQAADLGLTVAIDGFSALYDLLEGAVVAAGETLALAADALIDAYLVAWIADIDAGLAAWPELGRVSTVALMDPQARRDFQNEECSSEGAEGTNQRAECEANIGLLDVLLDEVEPFVNDHLLSMLGAPDFVGDIREVLQDVSATLDDLLEPVMPFNPLAEAKAEIKEYATELLKGQIEESLGVDVDSLRMFLTTPTSWLNVTGQIDIGGVSLPPLFAQGDRARLDDYLGFEGDHLVGDNPPYPGFPYASSRLADDATFSPGDLAIFDNTVMLGKLMLLDGPMLDRVLSDLTGRPYSFYGSIPNANVMLTTLPGVPGASNHQWIDSIDGDHVWRSNGLPIFDAPTLGEGNFPLWESCILREPAFRGLFTDWENGALQFPDLGDDPSPDPNDPAAPVSSATPVGNLYFDAGTTYVGPGATLRIDAGDDYWPTSDITVDVQITDSQGGSVTATVTDGQEVGLAGLADGTLTVRTTASDPCRTEALHAETIVLDTTPPALVVGGPYSDEEGTVIALDGTATTDAGSGVASTSWASAPTTLFAQNVDPADFVPADDGAFTFTFTATDNLGNTASQDVGVTVSNAAPTLVIEAIGDGPDYFLPHVGVPLAGTFNDPGTLDTHAATVSWGDGSTTSATVTETPFGPPGSVAGLNGSIDNVHAWTTPGFYSVEAAIVDDDGDADSADGSVEVVDPIEALERTIADLQVLSSDEAVAEALKDLEGPPSGGPPNSGALDKLADGDDAAAIVKIGAALEDLGVAQVDVGFAMLVLSQIAESVAAELELDAIAAVGPPSRGQQRQLDRIANSMAEGRGLLAADAFVAAVDEFHDAAARAAGLLP